MASIVHLVWFTIYTVPARIGAKPFRKVKKKKKRKKKEVINLMLNRRMLIIVGKKWQELSAFQGQGPLKL